MIIDDLPLCFYHSHKEPLRIVLNETSKMRQHIQFERISDGRACEHRDGCASAALFEVERTNYCLKHAERRIHAEAMFGKLRGVITVDAHRNADGVEADAG